MTSRARAPSANTAGRPECSSASTAARPDIGRLRPGALLRWYAAAARDLPWRASGASPWGVLVSEVMLQQTPVARVLPIWTVWLARWPTPAALAGATQADAVRAWGKLGYPRRAMRLHAAAQRIGAEFDGRVPSSVEELESLPGVGAYTARAVAAFAFGVRTPVVDTNVARVLARAVRGRAQSGPSITSADRADVAALLPAEPARAALFSVAVMELGALVCTAAAPSCTDCPVRVDCAWFQAGAPAYEGTRRPAPGFAGTDRQVRGLLLDILRGSPTTVVAAELDRVWPDAAQRRRALGSLLADGLVEELPGAGFVLAGEAGSAPR